MRTLLIILVQGYRWVLSPLKAGLFGPTAACRFHPSCSEYALEALRRHGTWRGLRLALSRIARCHPWGGCGHDPVPDSVPGATRRGGMRVSGACRPPRPGADPAAVC